MRRAQAGGPSAPVSADAAAAAFAASPTTVPPNALEAGAGAGSEPAADVAGHAAERAYYGRVRAGLGDTAETSARRAQAHLADGTRTERADRSAGEQCATADCAGQRRTPRAGGTDRQADAPYGSSGDAARRETSADCGARAELRTAGDDAVGDAWAEDAEAE